MEPHYQINEPNQIFSPGLAVFRSLVEQNLKTMIEMAGGTDRLRPHCKTHKMPAVIQMELELSITKHKAATLAEAEMLAQVGVKDIALAYSLIGPNIQRCVRLLETYPDVQIAVIADHLPSTKELSAAMSSAGKEVGVMLDLNPGRDRTGLPVGEEAAQLYRAIHELPGLRAEGFHLYDGHRHESDLAERRAAVLAQWEHVANFRDQLVADGIPVPRIICGGTPTFPVYAEMDDPTIELSPGTCVFHDASYGGKFPDLNKFVPAALLFTRVISRPTPNRVTFDLGTKAIASDPPMGERALLPAIPNGKQVLQNEEHLVVETEIADQFNVGDWTLAIPKHVCPCSALHQFATVIVDGEIVDEWPVLARDRRITV